jgi:radical SAM-linked protein
VVNLPRYRIIYIKEDAARFISHLDLLRTFERAVRRAQLPVTFSQGYNPHPKLGFCFPLAVGLAGSNEYMDIELDRVLSSAKIINTLNSSLPPGLKVTGCCRLEDKTPPLMAAMERSLYLLKIEGIDLPPVEAVQRCMDSVMKLSEAPVSRVKKDGRQVLFDIRPGLLSLSAREDKGRILVEAEVMSGSRFNVRPEEVVSVMRQRCGIFKNGCRIDITRTRVMGPGGRSLFNGHESE